MDVTLTPPLKRFVEKQIKAGRFENATDAINDGVRLLEKHGEVQAALRSDVALLGNIGGQDIEALCFLVLMEAVKSAQEDLRSTMAEVRAINAAKDGHRRLISKVARDVASNCGQRDGKPPLRFTSGGLGSAEAYRRVPVPHPDPEGTGGIRVARTDMVGGAMDICSVRAARDDLKSRLDTLSEMGEMESLRLQMAMDRLSKLMATLSNLVKKISDTNSTIISNLK